MEASLQQSHQELQAIYDGMVDGLLIADVDSLEFLRANQTICRMLGYSEQELVSLSVRHIHPPEELPNVLNRFAALVAGQLVRANNVPLLRKDGSVVHADVTRNLLQYHGRNCVAGFFRDNTERVQAAEELQHEHEVLRHLLKSQDRDRQIIAYEIHDGVAQLLAAATMQFEIYENMRRDAPKAAAHAGTAVADLLRQCHAEVRRLISGLRPPILDAYGVVAALQHLVYECIAQRGTRIEFQHDVTFDRLDASLENAIYRIAQESLANACQHSHSDKIHLDLTQHGETLRISVQDWGTGFDPQSAGEKCFGLAGIRQRARLLGGDVSITTRLGEGSHIVVELRIGAGSVDT
jgi:PAS domain S-box-containing protein